MVLICYSSINPLPTFFITLSAFNSYKILSKIPFINELLLGVLNSFDISRYSLIVTLTGIDVKLINSAIAIFINNVSIMAMRSGSQFWVFFADHFLVICIMPDAFLEKINDEFPVLNPVPGNLGQLV